MGEAWIQLTPISQSATIFTNHQAAKDTWSDYRAIPQNHATRVNPSSRYKTYMLEQICNEFVAVDSDLSRGVSCGFVTGSGLKYEARLYCQSID